MCVFVFLLMLLKFVLLLGWFVGVVVLDCFFFLVLFM